MQALDQTIEEVIANLSPLAVALLTTLPRKPAYGREDINTLLKDDFNQGILCARLFLALSKDSMEVELRKHLGIGGIGVQRYQSDREKYLDALEQLGLSTAMGATINYEPIWSDILVERLRSGRGSAIQGQRRGRGLEDFAEALVREVFGGSYETRCTFSGVDGKSAKCDVAIPGRDRPRVLIEVKGYGATGSKMSDIIGDLDAIIDAKRHDTALLFVTDGMTWNARLADLKKLSNGKTKERLLEFTQRNCENNF